MTDFQATTTPADKIPWFAIAGTISTVMVFAIAQGLTYPLLAFILEGQGTSPSLVGLSAAMTPLGFILSAPFIPSLARRIGGGRLAIVCSFLAAMTLIAIAVFQDAIAWMPLRFLLGIVANPLYVLSETWLISITPANLRGRILGLYSSIVSSGFAIGPLSLGLVGTRGWPPFVIGVGAFAVCGLIVSAVAPRLPKMKPGGEAPSVTGFFAIAPLLLFAVFVAAAFEQTMMSMFAVYGAAFGSDERRIAALLTTFVAGNAALQIVVGRLVDQFGSRRMLLFCAVAALAGCFLLQTIFDTWPIWLLLFVWGGASFGIYTVALIQLGERFTGPTLIAGNAAFAIAWGMGGVGGSPATGIVMQMMGPRGLPVFLGLLCVALALTAHRQHGRGERA